MNGSVSKMSTRVALLGALLAPVLALASIGKITALEGTAHRITPSGAKAKLAVGSEIELNDRLAVGKKANLKLTLTDGSMLMLGEESELQIDEATFKNQEREGFSAKLLFGKVWAKVTKALSGSNAKFEVTTDRAVAGVRGTIFRVDAVKLARAATSPGLARKAQTVTVSVVEGKVAVEAEVKKKIDAVVEKVKSQGPRVQIAGPSEISAEEWEKKFVELQANQSVTIGLDLWEEAQLREQLMKDSFARFALSNGGGE